MLLLYGKEPVSFDLKFAFVDFLIHREPLNIQKSLGNLVKMEGTVMKTSRVCSSHSVCAAFSLLLVVGLLSFGASVAFAQKAVGSPVTNADGSITQNYSNGSSVTTYPNGTNVHNANDDGKDVPFPPGTTKTTSKSDDAEKGGTKDVYKTPPSSGGKGGRTDTFSKDKNGKTRHHHSHKHGGGEGGTTDSDFGYRPDGSMIGGTTTIHPGDGGKDIVKETTPNPDGTTTTVTKQDGKDVAKPDAGKDAAKDAGKESGKEAGKDAAKESGKTRPPVKEGPAGGGTPSCGHCP